MSRFGVARQFCLGLAGNQLNWRRLLVALGVAGVIQLFTPFTTNLASPFTTSVASAGNLHETRAALLRGMASVGSRSGAVAVDLETGRSLFASHDRAWLVPASVTKLYTSATALLRLGPKTTLPTQVFSKSLPNSAGVIKGSIWLRGNGDPTFGRTRMHDLALKVRRAGVHRITGRVFGDESAFDRRRGGPASGWGTSPYVGPLSALSYNHGYTASGSFQTDPPRTAAEAFSAALRSVGVRTGSAGVGTTPANAVLIDEVRSAPIGRLIRLMNVVSDNYFAELLLKTLGRGLPGSDVRKLGRRTDSAAGIRGSGRSERSDSGGTAQSDSEKSERSDSGGTTRSDSKEAGKSDSVAAGTKGSKESVQGGSSYLASSSKEPGHRSSRALAQLKAGANVGSTTRGIDVIRNTWARFGVHPRIVDGSGLSHAGNTTARDIAKLLAKMSGDRTGQTFRLSLPVFGHDGTLRSRLRGTVAADRCRAKTGTLNGVSALAGYCLAANHHRIAFAFLMNGISAGDARAVQDQMTLALARYSG